MSRLYLLFRSTHETLRAESVIKAAGVNCKAVMKPGDIRSDCGLAVRVDPEAKDAAMNALERAGLSPASIHELQKK